MPKKTLMEFSIVHLKLKKNGTLLVMKMKKKKKVRQERPLEVYKKSDKKSFEI